MDQRKVVFVVDDDPSMLKGVRRGASTATTHSMVMRSKSGTVRVVEAEHNWKIKASL